MDDDVGTAPCQTESDFASDAFRRAGHERRLALQVHRSSAYQIEDKLLTILTLLSASVIGYSVRMKAKLLGLLLVSTLILASGANAGTDDPPSGHNALRKLVAASQTFCSASSKSRTKSPRPPPSTVAPRA